MRRTPWEYRCRIVAGLALVCVLASQAFSDITSTSYLPAEQQARIAYVMFCDDTCPLPKAYAGGPRKTVAGDDFPDFYFRGASLIHAFALLGEALE